MGNQATKSEKVHTRSNRPSLRQTSFVTTPSDAKAMARFWHKRWQEALKEKQFERAAEYFKAVAEWKQRANIAGMMGQEFEDEWGPKND